MRFNTSRFHWHEPSKSFISNLKWLGLKEWVAPYDHIYGVDEDTIGIELESHKTGRVVKYFLHEVRWDIDGWVYKPTVDAIKECPALEGTRVVIHRVDEEEYSIPYG